MRRTVNEVPHQRKRKLHIVNKIDIKDISHYVAPRSGTCHLFQKNVKTNTPTGPIPTSYRSSRPELKNYGKYLRVQREKHPVLQFVMNFMKVFLN